ncbi:unnamed protein product [Choristocarpus tenellus]
MRAIASFLLVTIYLATTAVIRSSACIVLGGDCAENADCCDDLGLNQGTSCVGTTCEAECSAVASLQVPFPMTGDMEISVPSTVSCDTVYDLHVQGGTLTLAGSQANFKKIRFIVYDGATIVFDIDTATFGPSPTNEDDSSGYMLWVLSGGTIKFTGDVEATGVEDVRSFIGNWGEIDFAGTTSFVENENVIRSNFGGSIRFGGRSDFINNKFLALSNLDSDDGQGGNVVFEEKAYFENNAFSFNGVSGGAVFNCDVCTTTFMKNAIFREHDIDEGAGGVANRGTMTFEKNAKFILNNANDGAGGGAVNTGDMVFNGDALFKDNTVQNSGGGLYNDGGAVTFNARAKFLRNTAEEGNGGGIVNINGGGITFAGGVPIFTDNVATAGNCANIYNESPSTVTGTVGDICNLQ